MLLARARREARAEAAAHARTVAALREELRAEREHAAAALVDETHDREALLRRSEHLASLGRMLAGAAHELNNPLAAVCGFAQILLRGGPRDEDRPALETIDHEARRAAAIVRDLLTFTRGRPAGARRLVDLDAVVRYVAQTRRYALERGGVELVLDLAPGPLEVLGEPAQLEQIVLNLVANAAEALEPAGGAASAPGGARVTLRTARLERTALLEVHDTGPGIAPELLPVIWDPFFTTKGARGTGLGLAVVHRLVTDHAGAVDVESRPGAGARFRVALPLPTPDEAAGARPSASGDVASQPLDILVLVGDREDAAFLSAYLGARGHAVLAAHDAAHAVRLAAGAGVDVVIAELRALDADGAVLRRLRARPAGDGARCIVTVPHTGDAPVDGPAVADALGDCVTLTTPYEIDELRRAVEGE